MVYHADSLNADSEKTLDASSFANAKEVNEHYKDLGVEASNGSKNVTIPWIDLPYIDTVINLDPLKQANRGAQGGFWNVIAPIFAPGTTDDEKQAINKALKEEARSVNINVKVTDKETGTDIMSFIQTPATYRRSVYFTLDNTFNNYINGEHPAVKLTISTDPITIKWWSGKVTLNFKPYEVYLKANKSIGSFEA